MPCGGTPFDENCKVHCVFERTSVLVRQLDVMHPTYWLSVQTSNQIPHPFCPHQAAGFIRKPNRSARVKLSELCYRPEPLDTNSIESAAHENFDLWCRHLLIVLQPFRSCFPRAVPTTAQYPIHLA